MRQTALTIALVLSVATSVNCLQLKGKDNKVLAEATTSITAPNVELFLWGAAMGYDSLDISAI